MELSWHVQKMVAQYHVQTIVWKAVIICCILELFMDVGNDEVHHNFKILRIELIQRQ